MRFRLWLFFPPPAIRRIGTPRESIGDIMLVDEVMTPDPTTLDVSATVRDAVNVLSEMGIRHLPIMEDGNLVGIVSDRDISAALGNETENADLRAERMDAPITSIMSSNVLSVGPEDDIGEAIDLMIEHKLGSLPVVTDDPQALVGVISYVDVLREARKIL